MYSVYDIQTLTNLPTGLYSDHFMIVFYTSTLLQNENKDPKLIYNYAAADWDGMNIYFTNYNFYSCFQSQDVEFIWDFIKTAIYDASNLYIPKLHSKVSRQPVWFNSSVRHQLHCTHTLRRKHTKKPTAFSKSKLNAAEHELQQLMIQAKANYEYKLIATHSYSNNNKVFQYISNLKGYSNLPEEMCYGELKAANDIDKANLFNKYFYSVFLQEQGNDYSCPSHCDHSLRNIEISTTEVYDILSTLDVTKAAGIDGINPRILRYCASSLLIPICHLFTSSIITGYIPSQWCIHCIIPIYKSGDKSSVKNYRPISLLCILSKVLERIIYNRMMSFLSNHFTIHQFGFLPGRSALQQLILFTEKLFNGKCNNTAVDVIYMDFKKAFDSVSHNALLCKLQSLGITGALHNWLTTYLTTRTQCVRIGSKCSNYCSVLSGVPQGSILGPLLFGIFINDLPLSVAHSIPFIYADDTKCLKDIHSSIDIDNLQSDLSNVSSWSSNWKLFFNEAKFIHVRFFAPNLDTPPIYTINNKTIEHKTQHKDLGVLYCNDLSWTEHYNCIISKAYKTLGLLRRTFKSNNIQTKKLLYISLVRSQLVYCSQIWRPHLIRDILLLERVQRRATKYILNDYNLSYESHLKQLHLLPLMYTYELNDLLFFIKSLKFPTSYFDISKYIRFSNYSTRATSAHKLNYSISPTSSTNPYSFFNRIIRLWNTAPVINLSLSIDTIKRHLTNFFWAKFTVNFKSDSPCTFHLVCPCYRCSKIPVDMCYRHLLNF